MKINQNHKYHTNSHYLRLGICAQHMYFRKKFKYVLEKGILFPIPRNGGAGELLSTCSFRVSGWDWAVVRVLLAGLAVLVQYVSNANLNLIEKEDYVTAADTAQGGQYKAWAAVG